MNTNKLLLTMFAMSMLTVGLIYGAMTNFTFKPTQGAVVQPSGGSAAPSGNGGVQVFGYAVTLQGKGVDVLKGSAATTNMEVWDSANNQVVVETSVPGVLTSLSTAMPNDFNGFIMTGNDNGVSGTDRGAEVYYHKYPISYAGRAGVVAYDNIPTYNESAITWTGYDDGTAESTINYSIGSGATFTAGELKLASGSKACIGNPEFANPIAVCFNVSGSGDGSAVGDWEKFEVASGYYVSKITRPGFLASKNVIGDCYILKTPALCDYADYKFKIIAQAASGKNPAETAFVGVIPLDLTYYKNDDNKWVSGWGDESDLSADADIGIATATNDAALWLT